jgi:FlaA1/EpsC-like NDP-sugar epimerase
MSSIMDKLNKNKIQYVGVRTGEKDIEEAIPVVEYTNMAHEIKNHCIKLCKEAISNNKI